MSPLYLTDYLVFAFLGVMFCALCLAVGAAFIVKDYLRDRWYDYSDDWRERHGRPIPHRACYIRSPYSK